MTLNEMKQKVLRLIEEINPNNPLLTDDPDISNKINDVINQIQNEISRIKKIPARDEFEVEQDEEMDFSDIARDLFQLNIVRGVKNSIIGNTIVFEESGNAKVYYYKYPKQITFETDGEFKFDLSTDVLEIMPCGIAGVLLMSDPSTNYGRIYLDRYKHMLQNLDPRNHTGSIYIEGDVNEFL